MERKLAATGCASRIGPRAWRAWTTFSNACAACPQTPRHMRLACPGSVAGRQVAQIGGGTNGLRCSSTPQRSVGGSRRWPTLFRVFSSQRSDCIILFGDPRPICMPDRDALTVREMLGLLRQPIG